MEYAPKEDKSGEALEAQNELEAEEHLPPFPLIIPIEDEGHGGKKEYKEYYFEYESEGGSASFETTHGTEDVAPICRQQWDRSARVPLRPAETPRPSRWELPTITLVCDGERSRCPTAPIP